MSDFFSMSEARELCVLILEETEADAATVVLKSGVKGFTAFTRNQITGSGDSVDSTATLQVVIGERCATVKINELDRAGIRRAVAKAEELVQTATGVSSPLGLVEPQQYPEVSAYFSRTHGLTAVSRAAAIGGVLDGVEPTSLSASGVVRRTAGSIAVANTDALYAYHRSTWGMLSLGVRNADGPVLGLAGSAHNDWGLVAPAADLTRNAVEKARLQAHVQPLEPGAYTVVLEPAAVADLVESLLPSFQVRAVENGVSLFVGADAGDPIGRSVVDDRITMLSDPEDPDILARPFTEDGMLVKPTTWIANGVLENLVIDRSWAAQQEIEPQPMAGGFKVSGGEGTTQDLVTSVARGILISRIKYDMHPSARRGHYPGRTRGGGFLIESGSLTRALGDLRFEANPLDLLNSIEAIGAAVRTTRDNSDENVLPVVVPPLLLQDFHLVPVSTAR